VKVSHSIPESLTSTLLTALQLVSASIDNTNLLYEPRPRSYSVDRVQNLGHAATLYDIPFTLL